MTEQNASEAQGANEQVQGTASQAEETQGDSRASEHAEKLRELEKDNKKYRDRIRALENDQKKREDAEKTQAQRLAEERDSYKSRAAFLEDKVKRSNFIEQVGLPNPRAG
jgi:chromosome segregation ATPase